MWHNYKIIISVLQILLAYFMFAYRNKFDNTLLTLGRAYLAVIVGWAYTIYCSLLVTDIDLKLAKSEREIRDICNGDGGRHCGALLIGWFWPLVLVLAFWLLHKSIAARRGANG